MILDACAFVGRWPFGRLQNQSVEDLLRLMDKSGIDRALVSPLSGVFYKNCQEANEELYFEIGRNANRLMLAAVCNPTYPGWQKDIKRSREVLSAVAVRIFPNYHGYELSSPEAGDLAEVAAAYEIPVFISLRMQDERHHPPAFMTPAVPVASAIELALAHRKTRFVLSMGRYPEVCAALKQTAESGNLAVDVAGVQGPTMGMQKLVDEFGSERILFGTELMLQYALPARMKIEYSDLSEADRERIYARNLEQILRR